MGQGDLAGILAYVEDRASVDRPAGDESTPAASDEGVGGDRAVAADEGAAAVDSVATDEGAAAVDSVATAEGTAGDASDVGGADAEQPRPRSSRRPRDMAISLVVLVVPILVLIGGYQVLSGRTSPVEVDPEPALNSAANAGMEAARPANLPDGWVPVSAVFQPAEADNPGDTLRIGYVTPDGANLQLLQSTVPAEELLPAELPDTAAPAGSLDVAGEPWQRYEGSDGHRALVLLETDRTVLVRGAAAEDELRELAASLR